jgi:hypothetical protein
MVQLEQQHDACKDDLNNALASKIAIREALKSSMAEKERNLRKSESEAEELFKVFHADLFVDCPLKMFMSKVTIQCQIIRQFNCALYVLCSNLQTIQLCFVCVCSAAICRQFICALYVCMLCSNGNQSIKWGLKAVNLI